MSNPIRYDPPLVRALATELHERLAGRAAHPLPVFDRDLSALLLLDGGEALRFDLHPAAGWVRIVPAPEGTSPPAGEARIVGVSAPADERRLRVELREGNRFRGGTRVLVFELHTNQWNALLVDRGTARIVSVLRARDAGARPLRPGEDYHPPAGEPRFAAKKVTREAAWEEWTRVLEEVPPEERRRAFVRHFATASSLNAASLLGAAGERADTEEERPMLRAAFERWWTLHTLPRPWPVLLETTGGPHPYPLPLDDFACREVDSLLRGMEIAAEARSAPRSPAADLLKRAQRRLASAETRVFQTTMRMAEASRADELRHQGDLILAYLHMVPTGASSARLPEFDGGLEVEVELDPTLRPNENAQRLYDEAARIERARERLPALLETAKRELARWQGIVAKLEDGEVPPEAERLLAKAGTAKAPSAKARDGERKPYRVYRSSGGLEIRVGKTSRDNDRLTFGHSAPGDVWLHARSVPGSHVILRWTDTDAPPARDLEEAATLAAYYSKARTSGTVAVDWTRRRQVRKPRGAPPGRVTIQQAKTLFVVPDAAVEQRLREDEGGPHPAA